jgi:hypothetical protein
VPTTIVTPIDNNNLPLIVIVYSKSNYSLRLLSPLNNRQATRKKGTKKKI